MRRYLPLVAVIAVGCGGSNSGVVSTSGGGSGATTPTVELGTARFVVDVKTGQVNVVPLQSNKKSFAAFGGTAIGLTSSQLLADVTGNGRYLLRVTAQNKTGEQIGSNEQGYRVVFSNFGNLNAPLLDARSLTSVATIAGSGSSVSTDGSALAAGLSPTTIARMPDGSLAFIDGSGSKLRLLRKGFVTTLNTPTPIPGALSVMSDGVTNTAYVGLPDDIYKIDTNNPVPMSFTGTGNAQKNVRAMAMKSTVLPTTFAVVRADGFLATAQYSGTSMTTFTSFGSALSNPNGVCFIGDNGVIVSETGANRLRYFNLTSGVTCTIGSGIVGATNGIGDVASFSAPQGIVNANGAVYVTDTGNHMIRQVLLSPGADPTNSSSWFVSTIAGGMPATLGYADGTGTNARFYAPQAITVDGSGNLVVSDRSNFRIRRVSSLSAGFPFGYSNTIGTATADSVRLANADGYFGSGGSNQPYYDQASPLQSGSAGTLLKDWQLIVPEGVNMFQFTVTFIGKTQTLASLGGVLNSSGTGSGSPDVLVSTYTGSIGSGSNDGKLADATYRGLSGAAIDRFGNLFLVDQASNTIRRVDRDGTVTTIAGVAGTAGYANGAGTWATFNAPVAIAVAPDGNVAYVADKGNNYIRSMTCGGIGSDANAKLPDKWQVSTLVGAGGTQLTGSADKVALYGPSSLCIASNGDIVYAEATGNRIKRIHYQGNTGTSSSGWLVSDIAGDSSFGTSGITDGIASAARFNAPTGVAIAPNGDIYVADTGNHSIRRISGDIVTRVAGTGSAGYADSLTGTSAKFNSPSGICIDSSGVVYISETGQGYLRKFTDPSVRTVAGIGGVTSMLDGGGNVAGFRPVKGIAVDAMGTVYMAEWTRVRMVNRLIDTGIP